MDHRGLLLFCKAPPHRAAVARAAGANSYCLDLFGVPSEVVLPLLKLKKIKEAC